MAVKKSTKRSGFVLKTVHLQQLKRMHGSN